MSFALYMLGTAILIGGLIYAGHLMHIAPHWLAVAALVTAGMGIMGGVQGTRQKDPP
jgi:hypothetical protein